MSKIHSRTDLTNNNLHNFVNNVESFHSTVFQKHKKIVKPTNLIYSNRKTSRDFNENKEIKEEDFEYILNNLYNSYPSAGGFYDVYSYLFINNVESYPSGIYHYNFSDEKPKCIYAGDIKAFVKTANIQHEIINKSSFFILFCADTRRYIKKYGERGYRFLMLETGHISQNVINLSSSLNIGNFSCGGYLDNRYKDVLELNDYEIITHQLALGINII